MIRRILTGGRHGRSTFPRRVRGYTLIELMMSVVLLGIGMALALPSYRDMVEKRQVTNAAEQVAAFVNSAQGAAMKTNRLVTVVYDEDADNNWCFGATDEATCDCRVTDPAADGFCAVAGQPFFLNNEHAGNLEVMHAMNGDGAYAFDPIRGVMAERNDDLVAELRSPSDDFRLNVQVNFTGRVIVCSESQSHAIPGYEICPVQAVVEEATSS